MAGTRGWCVSHRIRDKVGEGSPGVYMWWDVCFVWLVAQEVLRWT